jgi:hypothetical protein
LLPCYEANNAFMQQGSTLPLRVCHPDSLQSYCLTRCDPNSSGVCKRCRAFG